MEYELLGWPDDGIQLALDYRAFSYAGKFVMSTTGKAVVLDPDADPFGIDETASEERPAPATDADGAAPATDADGAAPATDADGVVDPGPVVGAVAFNGDRTDDGVAWLRYVTVRQDRRGEGIGPRLVAFTVERLRERGYDRVRIAVNNPFAYEALSGAGFAFTGEETGVAELVLEYPRDRSPATYQAGLDVFRARESLDAGERAFLDRKWGADPPDVVDPPE